MICSVLRDLVGLMDLEDLMDLMDLVGLKGLTGLTGLTDMTVALVGKRRPRLKLQAVTPAINQNALW
jgi:hypothetical protein